MGATLATVAIQELPGLIEFLKLAFVKANPGVPPPTDAEVIAAYLQALASSLARDELWLSMHPER